VRAVIENTIRSESHPAAEIVVDASLPYVGGDEFDLAGVARAERHHFVAHGRPYRRVIVQLERFLDSNDLRYVLPIVDPVRVGPIAFSTGVHVYSAADEAVAEPGRESDRTRRFLVEQGLEAPEELVMVRLATTFDPERRHELIVFYEESAAAHGLRAADEPPPELETALRRRALDAFDVR
jgi:hypothetical protein